MQTDELCQSEIEKKSSMIASPSNKINEHKPCANISDRKYTDKDDNHSNYADLWMSKNEKGGG